MCLARVYEGAEEDKAILEDIAQMVIGEDMIEVETLFGERRVLQGKVRKIDFLNSRVQLEKH